MGEKVYIDASGDDNHHMLWLWGQEQSPGSSGGRFFDEVVMRCPYCASEESKVVDSRDSEAGDAIRRRRECLACERRYTTYERVEELPLIVVKRSGDEELFTRAKLLNGLLRACEKRVIPVESLDRVVDEIENDLRRQPGLRVTSADIGEHALRHLKRLDRVAYVRFASVYRQFEDIDEFQRELARLEEASAGPLPGEEPLPGIGDEEERADARLRDHSNVMIGPSQTVVTGAPRGR
jgi:transcriptional repressor NrdR